MEQATAPISLNTTRMPEGEAPQYTGLCRNRPAPLAPFPARVTRNSGRKRTGREIRRGSGSRSHPPRLSGRFRPGSGRCRNDDAYSPALPTGDGRPATGQTATGQTATGQRDAIQDAIVTRSPFSLKHSMAICSGNAVSLPKI